MRRRDMSTSSPRPIGHTDRVARRSTKYDQALVAVRSIVNAHDPIGLIAGGAPSDEYDPEIAELVSMVIRAEPIREDAVDEVWIRWFGEEYGSAGSEQLARLTSQLRDVQVTLAKG